METFELVKAEKKDYYKFYTIYKIQNQNVWFPTSIDSSIELYCKFFDQDVYWVHINKKRVGGVLIEPEGFGFTFLIPPFHDDYTFFKHVVKHMKKITEKGKTITAFGMSPQDVKWLQLFGFQKVNEEKDMICPSSTYDVCFPEDVYVDVAKKEYLEELIDFYYQVFSNSKVENLAKKPYEFYKELLTEQINEIQNEYTTILRDVKTKEIVGSCTAQIWFGLPSILDLLVKPTHEGKGLASMMVKKVLDSANKNNYPAVCLSVVVGNSAEYLYHKLGFLSAVSSSTLILK